MSFTSVLDISDKQILDACRVVKLVGEKAKEAAGEQLIEEDKIIELTVDYFYEGERKNTPVSIVLKNGLFNTTDGDNALLILSTPNEKVKDILKENPVDGIAKVTTLDKIRKTFARFEQKRDLVGSYTRILADAGVIPMIPSVLGNACMKNKKHPIPVKITKMPASLKTSITKALNSTSFFVNWAPVSNIKVGKMSFTDEQLLENIRTVLEVVYKYIKAENIECMNLKLSQSISIPFYQKKAADLLKEVEEQTTA